MTYSIGTHTFVTLFRLGGRGEGPELLNTDQAVIARPGPDGLNVRRQGVRGNPFQMRSTMVFATNTLVLDALADYYATQSLVATLTWEGVNFSTVFGVAYTVLKVSEPLIEKLGAAAWLGTDVSGFWRIEATWLLLPVDVNQAVMA